MQQQSTRTTIAMKWKKLCCRKKAVSKRPDYIPFFMGFRVMPLDEKDFDMAKIKKKEQITYWNCRGNPKREICNLRRCKKRNGKNDIQKRKFKELNKKGKNLYCRTAKGWRNKVNWKTHAFNRRFKNRAAKKNLPVGNSLLSLRSTS